MSQLDDEVTVVVTNKPDSELYAVFEESNFDVNVGESGALQVSEGIQYIQSGKKEIGEAVAEVKAEITAHATQKTAEFDENAEQKTNNFNDNATDKTQAFNTNATEKTNAYNQNASSLTADFNNNANTQTNVFNQNANDKTTAFNNNYAEKKALIDAEVQTAETAATDASNYSAEAKQWAIGDPSEPTGNSSKYWAEASASAAATVGNGTITLTQGGATKGTFTTNQSGDTTINLDAGGTWGYITGDISDQTDLQEALAEKQNKLTAGTDLEIVTQASETTTITGENSISLNNAKINSLQSVIVSGATEQARQDILPEGYTQLQYINDIDATYIDLGMHLKTAVHSVELKASTTSLTNNNFFGARNSTTAQAYTLGVYYNKWRVGWGTSSQTFGDADTETHTFKINNTDGSFYVDDVLFATLGAVSTETPKNAFLGGVNAQTGGIYDGSGKFYYLKIWQNDTLLKHLLPAKRTSDNAIGMYDVVNDAFFTNSGTDAFTGGGNITIPTPEMPIDIVSNNGVLKVSGNLLNRNDLEGGYLLTDDGQRGSSNNNWILTNFIKVKPNTSYIFDFVSGADSVYRRVCGYSSNDYNSFTELLVKKQRPVTEGVRYSEPFTTSATTNYIKISTYKADTNIQVTEGTEVIPYRAYGEVYTDGTTETITDSKNNSATAQMLLNLSTYSDTQEILSGTITRNIAVKILNGTENWAINDGSTYPFFRLSSAFSDAMNVSANDLMCSHFPSGSVGGINETQGIRVYSNAIYLRYDNLYPATSENLPLFKQWLAKQYAKGTPVILVYPITTATTETVAGQTLNVQDGDNTLTVTGALSDLPIYATYTTKEINTINFTNESGYTSNVGTVTSVNNTLPDASGNVTISAGGGIPPIAYATSTSAASTVEKVVSIPEITELNVGQIIVVQPTITSSVANSTIKLNNFDAYPMRYSNAAITTSTDATVWSVNYPSQFVFDGTYWVFLGHGTDTNTTYTINYSIDAGAYKSGIGNYAITRYSLCMQKPDMTWEKVTATSATYSTGTSKSVNTRGFILGNIRYYNTTAIVANGANTASNTMNEKAATLDFRYSTNCGSTPGYATGDYVYFVGTIGADGLFYLDTTQWWTNTLPTTNDGKLYVQIGKFLADYNVTLYENHPAYYYDGSKLCEYKVADNKQDTISDLSTIRGGATLGASSLQPGDNVSELTNDSGYITGINSSDVTTALGYTPADDGDVVKTTGNQIVGGIKKFTEKLVRKHSQQNAFSSVSVQVSAITKGTNPTVNTEARWHMTDSGGDFGNAYSIAGMVTGYSTSGTTSALLVAFEPQANSTVNSSLGIFYPATGNPYTVAPTPASSDNSTKIATTAYVHNFFAAISGYDATKTQTLKNINGTLTWVTD